jgi:hypothetical protein
MALRYLRRPPKLAVRKREGRPAKAVTSTEADCCAAVPVLEVMPEESTTMAQALAYFCVACGREHPSGEIRDGDIHCAEVDILSVISRAQ